MAARSRLSPGRALIVVGAAHDVWGLVAYRRPLREIARARFRDTVGDGLIRRAHFDDDRAAAFWFMFAGPVLCSLGYLVDRADLAGDRRALHVSALATAAVGAVGTVVIPRAPFPVAFPLAAWIVARARES